MKRLQRQPPSARRSFLRASHRCAGIVLAFAGATASAQSTNGFDNYVSSIAVQSDGKIVAGGQFAHVGGLYRPGVARLLSDGRVDAAFAPPLPATSRVDCLLLLGDGSLLIGGYFQFSGSPLPPAKSLLHINADGSLADNPLQPDGSPTTLALQADGKILVGSGYTNEGANQHYNIGRLNADFTLDDAFAPGLGAAGTVNSIAVQSDGQILIGGNFEQVNGVLANGVARLDSAGNIDASFVWPATYNGTPYIYQVVPLSGGKVLVGGSYSLPGISGSVVLSRLNSDASLDTGFTPLGYAGGRVDVALSNGQILDGGFFGNLGNYPTYISRNNIGRVNADGSPDATFIAGTNPDSSGTVDAIAVQTDGAILIGGYFTVVNGQSYNRIARLLSNGAPDQSFSVDDRIFANGFQ